MLADEMELSKAEQIDLLNAMKPYRDELVKLADAQDRDVTTKDGQIEMTELLAFVMEEGADATQTAADAYMEQANEVQGLQSQLSELIDTINAANGVGQDAVSQNIRYQETLAAVNQAIADGAYGLDLATDAGRTNMDMLVGLASDAQSAAAAQLELDGSTAGYMDRMIAGREALINSAVAMGYTQEQAIALANKIYAIPTEPEITAIMHTAQAQTAIDNFVNKNGNRTINVWLNPKTQAMNDAFAQYLNNNANGGVYSGGVKKFAAGGFEPGIYPYVRGGIHKFAEEYGEAYISMDPARRERSEAVWVRTGQELGMFSGSGPSGPTHVEVSLAGAELTLMVDGNPVRAVVQQQILDYDMQRSQTTRRGVRTS